MTHVVSTCISHIATYVQYPYLCIQSVSYHCLSYRQFRLQLPACVANVMIFATGKDEAAAATLDTNSKNTEYAETLGNKMYLYYK